MFGSIVDTNLAGFTVEYNDVQFGGNDATYKSLPPTYHFRADPKWDDSHRAVVSIVCTLFVRCIFNESTETTMGINMREVRRLLMQPGRPLGLSGLGSGFNTINRVINPLFAGDFKDIAGGPHPLSIECTPIGQLCWELAWGIQFEVSPCYPGDQTQFDPLAFTEFNFSTTWRNDFEGYSARIIQGYVKIPFTRDSASPKTVLHVAEQTRGRIVVALPDGYKRIENVWHEREDKHRLDFTIVDQQMQGDAYPAGITQADGNFSINTGSAKGFNAMNQAVATFSVLFKIAYNKPKSLALQTFVAMVQSKQTEIQAAMDALHAAEPLSVPTGIILPIGFSASYGKFDGARVFQGSIAWHLTQDFNSILRSTRMWEPVAADTGTVPPGVDQTYSTWKASMTALWGNRGTSLIESLPAEAVVIDLCDNVQTKTIGVTGSSPNEHTNTAPNALSCPEVPANGGWLHFSLDVQLLRDEQVSQHQRAAVYLPNLESGVPYPYNAQPTTGNGTAVLVGGPTYSQNPDEREVIEYHGYPKFYVGLTFTGVRFKHVPFIPAIKSVAGIPVTEYGPQQLGTPKHVMDSLGCPVWAISGYRVYSVPGYVNAIKPVSSLTAKDISIPLDL